MMWLTGMYVLALLLVLTTGALGGWLYSYVSSRRVVRELARSDELHERLPTWVEHECATCSRPEPSRDRR